jgi:hypothetical protein
MSQHEVIQAVDENPPLFTAIIDYFSSSDPQLWNSLMVKPKPWNVSDAVVQAWTEAREGTADTLTIAGVSPGYVVAEMACWFKQVRGLLFIISTCAFTG